MNMIKTVTVASVLAAASIAQADVLFDSTSPFEQSAIKTVGNKTVGMTILTQDSLSGTSSYNLFTFTGAGELSFVTTSISGSTADFAMYANDKMYEIDGTGYWGPGLKLAGTEFSFDTYAAGEAGHISTTAFKTFDTPVEYHDRNWAGVSVMVTSEQGISLPLSQLAGTGYNTIAAGLDIRKDYWESTSANFDAWSTTDPLDLTAVEWSDYKPFSFSVEGNVQVVPEATTIQLALMGLAAIGGFAGLRRFKRN